MEDVYGVVGATNYFYVHSSDAVDYMRLSGHGLVLVTGFLFVTL